MTIVPESLTDPPAPSQHAPGNALDRPTPIARPPLKTIFRAVELRLRFIALIAVTAAAFAYGETVLNHYEKWARPKHRASVNSPAVAYFCPMHPNVIRDQPSTCPSCGMPLARRKKDRGLLARDEAIKARVQIAPDRISQAGIRTVEVRWSKPRRHFVAVGTVGFDETRRVVVASNTRGRLRVERLNVSSDGVKVKAGQTLAELSGYDLSQAIRVFLDARRSRDRQTSSERQQQPAPLGDPDERIRLAIQALLVLGVRKDQIEAVADAGDSDERLPILAPVDGHVIRKDVWEGQYVNEGATLFEIADLTHVWVDTNVFEDQLGLVELGSEVHASLPAFPGEVFGGRVALIAPTLDSVTRTADVRVELENRDYRLRPGMFATVTFNFSTGALLSDKQTTCPVTQRPLGSMGDPVAVQIGTRTVFLCCEGCVSKLQTAPERYLAPLDTLAGGWVLSVPESAVIDTGAGQVVYVESSPGVFEARTVTLGPKGDDRYPVLDGLLPGDRLAAAGTFLIDAESRLNAATRSGPVRGETIPASEAAETAGVGLAKPEAAVPKSDHADEKYE
jgi:Cu(I)/Ag(I) efflux system membrane fusion protein